MTTYPSVGERRELGAAGPYRTTRTGRLRNAGYAEAMWDLREMAAVGMRPAMLWVDVEPYPVAPWSPHHGANRAVITGALRAYRDHHLRIGIYTYANGWRQVVGRWLLNDTPAWTTVGSRGRVAAHRSCAHRGPSGGTPWLAQWNTPHRDHDLVCPAASSHVGRLLARWS